MTAEKDARHLSQALVALLRERRRRRDRDEEEDDEEEESARYYSELCQEARDKGRKAERYALALLAGQSFYEALAGAGQQRENRER